MDYKPRIQIEGNSFHIIYEQSSEDFLDLLEKGRFKDRLVLRKNGYCVTDKKTKIKYIVNYQKKFLKLSFKKSDLNELDLEVLLESLTLKILQQQNQMKRMFSEDGQLNEICIREIEYAPTDIVIEIVFGKMMIAKFYISCIIGNSLMSVEERYTKFMIINLELLEGNKFNQEVFKYNPLNLHFLTQFTAIDKFIDLIHRTFIPIQLLNYKLINQNTNQNQNLFSQLYQYYLMIYPNQQFAAIVFGVRQDKLYNPLSILPLLVQLKTFFSNDKLVIEIEQADAFAMLNQYHSTADFAFFKKEIHEVIQKWTFTTCQELDEFLNRFLLIGCAYFFLYPKKEQLFQLLKKPNSEFFEKQTLYQLISKIASLHVNLNQKQRQDPQSCDYKSFFNLYIDRYFHIFEYITVKEQKEDRESPIRNILRSYLDKLEKNLQNMIKSGFKEIERNLPFLKLDIVQFEGDKIQFSFQTIKYIYQNSQIIKIEHGQETNRWKLNEFPRDEQEFIKCQL